ncbi:MAG: response regulator, partial [Deltaproteobacteria bacterium]|nr:response regulator [Deltaproteobacteria bacterium]
MATDNERRGPIRADPCLSVVQFQGGNDMSENKNKATAVVVNDDTTQLGILSGLARKAGLEPLSFTGAEAALAAMKPEDPPDIIVTDLYMPGLDGWRFCRL